MNAVFGQLEQGAAQREQVERTDRQGKVSVRQWLPVWLPGAPEDRIGGPGLLAGTTAELVKLRVGVAGFEPTTSSSRTKRATKLRYTPMTAREV
jgi:hypothetical protein